MENNGVHDWQSTKSCLTERTTYLLDNEFRSDISFIIGKKPFHKRFQAHKLMLSIGSCVFNDMFSGEGGSHVVEVEIFDVEPSAFSTLIRYLYTDTLEITDSKCVISILYVAQKYKVPSLQAECVKFLSNGLSHENVILALTQARLYNERLLEEECWAMIDNDPLKAFEGEDFTNIDLDTLCLILTRDTLRVNEADLYRAALDWSVAECKRQKLPRTSDHQKYVLGRALKLIRFPLMTPEEFSRVGVRSGLLPKDEIITIFLCICEGTKQSTNYNVTPRLSSQINSEEPRVSLSLTTSSSSSASDDNWSS